MQSLHHTMPSPFTIIVALIITAGVLKTQLIYNRISTSQVTGFTSNPTSVTFGSHARDNHSTVAPFVFDSLHGLLKQWPNSYAPNGHSIVVGTVVPFTHLYHARRRPGLPDSLQFFAFDA